MCVLKIVNAVCRMWLCFLKNVWVRILFYLYTKFPLFYVDKKLIVDLLKDINIFIYLSDDIIFLEI